MPNTSKGFMEAFREFISGRVAADLDKCLLADSEYNRINSEIETQEEKIITCVHSGDTSEFDALFDRLSSMLGEMENAVAEIMYLQGMKDGFRLHTLIMLDEKGDWFQ